MATVGANCDMKLNRLYLSLIHQNIFYEHVKNKSKATLIELCIDAKLVATGFCDYDFNEESEDGALIDTQPKELIDAFAVQQSVDTHPLLLIDTPTLEPINTFHANGCSNPVYLEYDEDYREEEIIEYCGIVMEEVGVFQVSHRLEKSTMIDGNNLPSMNTDQEA
ncbi:hypothetical protein N665_0681s0004 [Sinapis alba]|nr:hypothetical protein N665_0681s0004 [Sinapis alba]